MYTSIASAGGGPSQKCSAEVQGAPQHSGSSSTCRQGGARSTTHGSFPAYSILQPRERNQEQRREDNAEQRVDPDQANIEAAEAESDPENAQRSVSFQESAPVAVKSDLTA